MPDGELMPSMIWQRIRSRWWLPVALAVLGGLIGWTLHLIKAPVLPGDCQPDSDDGFFPGRIVPV